MRLKQIYDKIEKLRKPNLKGRLNMDTIFFFNALVKDFSLSFYYLEYICNLIINNKNIDFLLFLHVKGFISIMKIFMVEIFLKSFPSSSLSLLYRLYNKFYASGYYNWSLYSLKVLLHFYRVNQQSPLL